MSILFIAVRCVVNNLFAIILPVQYMYMLSVRGSELDTILANNSVNSCFQHTQADESEFTGVIPVGKCITLELF